MLQHVVLFRFGQALSAAEEEEMRAAVARFPQQVGEATRLRLGTDLTGARTDGYQYLLYSEFPDDASLRRYRDHPVHQDFLRWLREHEAELLAFDYHIDDATVLIPE